jgi:hypothetical protein
MSAAIEPHPQAGDVAPTKPTMSKLQACVLGAFAINVIVTYVSMTGAYGCTNKGISDKYYTLISPPGWAFAIWGLIFISEGIACIYAAVPQLSKTSSLVVDNTFLLCWGLACVAQCAWSVAICHSIGTAAALLFLIWLALAALQQTSLGKLAALGTAATPATQVWLYVLLVAPFSLHLGWVTAASVLNINLFAVASEASAETQVFIAIASLLWVTIMGWTIGVTGLSWSRSVPDVAMAAGVIWALFAISKHDTSRGVPLPAIVNGAISSSALFAAAMLAGFVALRHAIVAGTLAWKHAADNAEAATKAKVAPEAATPLVA